jgi:hypothetical protein
MKYQKAIEEPAKICSFCRRHAKYRNVRFQSSNCKIRLLFAVGSIFFAAFFFSCLYAQSKETYIQYTLRKGGKERIITCCIENKKLLVPVEDFSDFAGLPYEVCERCGNTAITKINRDNTKDVLLVEWNSPYVYYQNKKKKITLAVFNRRSDNKTYTELILFKKIGIDYKENKALRSLSLDTAD